MCEDEDAELPDYVIRTQDVKNTLSWKPKYLLFAQFDAHR